nr:glycerol-3-phosphate 1-O-acyltransferase PlsY [uncultured Cellulosilyticum sp.]
MYRLGALVIGYLLGGVQSAILLGKLKGIDIRLQGSGNAGTTNTVRVLGKKAGAMVLLMDIAKTLIAMLIARLLFNGDNIPSIVVSLYAGIGVILGHSYPIFFGFRGGKGIAATAGLIIGIGNPLLFLILAATFFTCFGITKIVSLSSLLVTGTFPFWLILFYCGQPGGIEAMVLGFVIMAITYYRHKDNIKRLLTGTESKLNLTSKK